jgi:hypothetical protein
MLLSKRVRMEKIQRLLKKGRQGRKGEFSKASVMVSIVKLTGWMFTLNQLHLLLPRLRKASLTLMPM